MTKYYLAVDIGASSGRLILGHLENGKMELEEVHRFENGMVKKDGELCWEFDRLFQEIKNGLKKCKEIGKIPVSMGVDTWGVDFVLLDKDDKVLGNTVGYRDHRTEGMDEEVYKTISLKDLYARTGIQKAIYNTVYQLMAVKKKHPEYLEQAETLLHVPDYFHFLLTGEKTCEYTEATTGQLVCPTTKDWDYELIDMLGYPRKIFQKLIMPSTSIGHLTDAVKEAVGFDLEVVAPATHDTGSAVLAVPANDDDFIYISSGTWSLMGIERKEADCSEKSCEMNFTNEGGYAGRFRYLKNIMGLWMIQSVRHEVNDKYSFAEICSMAEEAKDFPSRVDANDECFLSPESMIEEVKDYCRRTGQKVPETLGEIATVIYTSLAECYAKTAKELEEMDLEGIIRIHPDIVIVDELAHTNVEGSRNEKRWQDVMDLLDEGINVISAVNIQHIESVNEEVQGISGIEVKERIPDSVLQEADEVVNIDLTAEELITRLKAGKIYKPEKVPMALNNFFKTENILQLRELALKEVALRVEKKVENEVVMGVAVGLRHEKFMACISSHEKTPRRIIRKAAKLATRYNTTFIALYVQTPKESMDRIGLARQRYLLNHFKLVTELGGEVVQVQSRDILGSIVEICKEKQISTVCMGSPDLKLPYAICSILGYRKFLNNLSRANVDLIILA